MRSYEIDDVIHRLGEIESTVAKLARRPSNDGLQPIGLSVATASKLSGLSKWTIRDMLRRGELEGRKSGARTIVAYESFLKMFANLPKATFAEPVEREKTGGKPNRFAAGHAPLRRKKARAA